MTNSYINTLLVKFDNEISFNEISLFRGAVLNSIGKDVELLFHNHTDVGFRYSYPLIQYKRIHKNAAILCIGDGVEAIGQFFEKEHFLANLGTRPVQLSIKSIIPQRTLIQIWDATFRYYLRNWLPLNSENYEKYKRIDGVAERVVFLEKILVGNILSFAKGLDINIEKEIECKLILFREPRLVFVKNIKVMSFDVEFKTNLSLPDYIGIGKHSSIGFGTIVRAYNNEYKDE